MLRTIEFKIVAGNYYFFREDITIKKEISFGSIVAYLHINLSRLLSSAEVHEQIKIKLGSQMGWVEGEAQNKKKTIKSKGEKN